ncbi:MAG TPA: hypothetical protein DHW42_05345 [Candidatus Marinimicrobia bacterium]|nr:hypothetical protein [Candidatus Neomarinimicrobiota bacterium]
MIIQVHNPDNLTTIPYSKLEDFQGDFKKTITKEALNKLKNSIIKHGIFVPKFVWRQNGQIFTLDGHQTKKALIELEVDGYEIPEIPIIEIKAKNRKDAAEKLLQINSRYADINPETSFFKDFDFDMSILDDIEMPEIKSDLFEDKKDGLTDDDAVPEEVEPKCKEGDLFQLGNHRLLAGNSTKSEDVQTLMGRGKIDMLLTDPPYGLDYSGKNEFLNKYDKGNHIQKDIKNDNIEDYKQFYSDFISVIPFNDYNTIYIFMSSKELHNLRLAIEDCGCVWGDYLVWVKNNHVLGRKDYNPKCEYILYGWKTRHKFYGGFEVNVIRYNKPSVNNLHPTMKPVGLLEKLLRDGSKVNSIIYDPFLGSGSTLIACEKTNRRCYGMEIDLHYCDVIIKRWEDFTGQKAKLLN